VFKFPLNRQLKDQWLCHARAPGCSRLYDINGEPCLIVMKDGNTTDLTVGQYADLEAYVCDDLGVESIELAIYNYDKQSGPFSAKGDFHGKGSYGRYSPLWDAERREQPRHLRHRLVCHRATQTQVSARRLSTASPSKREHPISTLLLHLRLVCFLGARLSIGYWCRQALLLLGGCKGSSLSSA